MSVAFVSHTSQLRLRGGGDHFDSDDNSEGSRSPSYSPPPSPVLQAASAPQFSVQSTCDTSVPPYHVSTQPQTPSPPALSTHSDPPPQCAQRIAARVTQSLHTDTAASSSAPTCQPDELDRQAVVEERQQYCERLVDLVEARAQCLELSFERRNVVSACSDLLKFLEDSEDWDRFFDLQRLVDPVLGDLMGTQ